MTTLPDLTVIPPRIKLSYHRPPNFQLLPEALDGVEAPEGHTVSKRWVIVCRAVVIEAIKARGGSTVITAGQDYIGPGSKGGRPVDAVIGDIVAERYVNHRDYGLTRYVAALFLRPLTSSQPREPRDRHRVIYRSRSAR